VGKFTSPIIREFYVADNSATFKFLTSVAGMVVSLGMAIANRVLL